MTTASSSKYPQALAPTTQTSLVEKGLQSGGLHSLISTTVKNLTNNSTGSCWNAMTHDIFLSCKKVVQAVVKWAKKFFDCFGQYSKWDAVAWMQRPRHNPPAQAPSRSGKVRGNFDLGGFEFKDRVPLLVERLVANPFR